MTEISSIANDLMATYEFRRLSEISFLGSVDYINRRNNNTQYTRFSRAEHTFGVYELADIFCRNVEIDYNSKKIIIATSICHDMGHSAFSHSLENVFKEFDPDLNHKEFLKVILRDRDSEAYNVLKRHEINPEKVISLANGDTGFEFNWLFHGSINIDTIDGMHRFLVSFRLTPPFRRSSIVESLILLYNKKGISSERVREMDNFWEVKSGFYESFLRRGYYAEFEKKFMLHMKSHMRDANIRDFFYREDEILEMFGRNIDKIEIDADFSGPRRVYDICKDVAVYELEDLDRRYIRH